MGFTIYVPDDVAEPYLVAEEGHQDAARDRILDTLTENAPEVEDA